MKKLLLFYLGVLIFSILISIPLLIPYIHSGYFPTHDGEWAVVRLVEMFREIKDFQIPPRFSDSLNFGYGYPLFNFTYPFPYYLGIFIHLLGFNFINSIKIIFALTVPVSAYFMFFASRKIWKNDYAGIISTVLYLYFPYRLVDLFVRGSIGESIAFALYPIILLCVYKSFESKNKIFYLVTAAICYATLITTHNISAVLFSVSLLFFFAFHFLTIKKDVIKHYLFFSSFGFLLSAYFWVPALLEKKNIALSVKPIADRNQFYVSIKEFLFDSWGYEVPTDKKYGFSYQVGWPFIATTLSVIIFLIYQKYKNIKINRDEKQAIMLMLGSFVFVFLLFRISAPFWKIPLLSEINFPWICLAQIGLLISILAGYLTKSKLSRYIALVIVLFSLLLYIPLAKPSQYVQRDENQMYISNDRNTTSSSELMPLWVISAPVQRYKDKIEILKGKSDISGLVHNSKKIYFATKNSEDSTIRINTIYYPGWKFTANGKTITINYSNDRGVMDLSLPKGDYVVEGSFGETPMRAISDYISLVSLFAVAGILVFGIYKMKDGSS